MMANLIDGLEGRNMAHSLPTQLLITNGFNGRRAGQRLQRAAGTTYIANKVPIYLDKKTLTKTCFSRRFLDELSCAGIKTTGNGFLYWELDVQPVKT